MKIMKKTVGIKLTIIILFLFLLFNNFTEKILGQQDVESILKSEPGDYLEDYANVIVDTLKVDITDLCRIIDAKSSVEIAVVTIPSLGLYSIEEFSYKLLEKWGVGQKDQNNGILITLALNEKKVRIEVGYGLEPLIPDSKAMLIIQNYGIPEFKNSNYGKGLYNMVYQLGYIIAKEKGEDFSSWVKEAGLKVQNNNEGSMFFFFVLLIIIFFIFNMLFRRPRYIGYRNRSVANQLFNAYLASSIMKNTFFGNNSGFKNSGFGGFKGGGFGGFGGFGGGSSGGGGATGGW